MDKILPDSVRKPQKPREDDLRAGHETSDAEIRPIILFLVGLGVFMVISMLLMAGLYSILESRQVVGQEDLTPLMDTRQIPSGPRLQADPAIDLDTYHLQFEEELNRYRWLDQKSGVAQVPVERAMELLLEQGLPARSTAPQEERTRETETSSSDTATPEESSQ